MAVAEASYEKSYFNEITKLLVRSSCIAFGISFLLIVLQYPIELAGFAIVETTEEIR